MSTNLNSFDHSPRLTARPDEAEDSKSQNTPKTALALKGNSCPNPQAEGRGIDYIAQGPICITEAFVDMYSKRLYGGLCLAEHRCTEFYQQLIVKASHLQADGPNWGNRWQYLTTLNCLLLNEFHDFVQLCQHPLATASLKALPFRLQLFQRIRNHCIFSCLQLLAQGLPQAAEHFGMFFEYSYCKISHLVEYIGPFQDILREILGDLASWR